MKKVLHFFAIFFSSLFLYAQEVPQIATKVQQYTLENGMEVFLLEDYSSPIVHCDFSVRAGFSNQTIDTNGYFKLYTRIIKESLPSDFLEKAECSADATRYSFSATTSSLEEELQTFGKVIFSTQFSEDILTTQLEIIKNEVEKSSEDPAVLINSAIDSRIFADAPWQHDSGIYPQLFKGTTAKTARNTLSYIGNRFYTPQNSALFISGNINSEDLLTAIKNIFGKYYSSYEVLKTEKSNSTNLQRKFVIHDKEFSSDLTQIVVQYTSLNMEQAELLAISLDNNYSSFKQKSLAIEELNIPGNEYIYAESAHKGDTSRLIIQTLLQNPENKDAKTNSAQMSELFLKQVLEIPSDFNNKELIYARNRLQRNLTNLCASRLSFMDSLVDFWAIEPYFALQGSVPFENEVNSPLVKEMLLRFWKINQIEQEELFTALEGESPYIFVLISDEDFKKNKKQYLALGYEEISSRNASWYVQEMYKNKKNQFKPEDNQTFYINTNYSDNNFYERNLSQIKTIELSNGIPVIYKQNPLSSRVTLLINIEGGRLKSADNNGFEEVMISIVSNMLQREFNTKTREGILLSYPTVSYYFKDYTSFIIINCDTEDFLTVCNTAAKTLIYGDVMPATADRAVNTRQYRKRLENGSAENQMYCAAIQTLFPNSDFAKYYESKKEILQDTNYTKILSAYPELLEAHRYSLIITGNFPEASLTNLDKGFGQLTSTHPENDLFYQYSTALPKNKSTKVKIVHTFLTDIPAEKAGPQPAVLIPTTEFKDPVMYFIKAPDSQKDEAIFEALLNYFGNCLNQQLKTNKRVPEASVNTLLPKTNIPLGQLTIRNVTHTAEVDAEYKNTLNRLNKEMNSVNAEELILKIKNYWTSTRLENAISNEGTAALIQEGFEACPENPDPAYYLKKYHTIQSATVEDFQRVLATFPSRPDYRFYSEDSQN